ncbi:unnamed protein product [Polarella glacialis]|uniref:Uncharacterized protein n=1 Tax=Polarella glacialis TaxID=89957 RepID=A0A813DK03_POLGL|nr:unnamed protein product [Polarella glacialis]
MLLGCLRLPVMKMYSQVKVAMAKAAQLHEPGPRRLSSGQRVDDGFLVENALIPFFIRIGSATADQLPANAQKHAIGIRGTCGGSEELSDLPTFGYLKCRVIFTLTLAVYKKDGETLYLLNNACDEFQIDTVASKTECTGLAVKKNGVWVFGGKEDPNVKVRTAAPGETYAVVKVDIEAILRGEAAKIEKEGGTATFRGTLEDDEELIGDRLMKMAGVKIKDGM